MDDNIIDRHNGATGVIELATMLQRLSSRLLEAHTDRGNLIMSRTRLVQMAMAKGYRGDSRDGIIEAAIKAAPEVEEVTAVQPPPPAQTPVPPPVTESAAPNVPTAVVAPSPVPAAGSVTPIPGDDA